MLQRTLGQETGFTSWDKGHWQAECDYNHSEDMLVTWDKNVDIWEGATELLVTWKKLVFK